MSQNKARGKPKTPSGGGGTLFSYFKPKTPSSAATCDSPTPSTNGKQAAVGHGSVEGDHVHSSKLYTVTIVDPVPIIDQLVTAVRLDNSLDPSLRKRVKLVCMTQLTKLQYINITGPL